MGLNSHVSAPYNVLKRNKITTQWQGRYREVRPEGSQVIFSNRQTLAQKIGTILRDPATNMREFQSCVAF